MSSLNICKIKIPKNIFSSLETSTKNSNSIKSYGNISKNIELNKSNSQCILPIIKPSNNNTISMPTSVLSRFINNHTSKIKNLMKNEITSKITIKKKVFVPSRIKSRNINKNNHTNMHRSQSLNDIFNSNANMLFITERDMKMKNNNRILSKIRINKNNYINNKMIVDKNNTLEELTYIKNTTNENDDSFLNEKDLNNINIQYSNLISDIVSRPLTPKNNDSIERPSKEKSKINNVINRYSRLCKYEPKNILKSTSVNSNDYFEVYNPDIKYQSNVFDEQVKLFKNKLNEYKMLTKRNNFMEIFKSISLDTKVNYNKNLEEICGTLYILPKLLLGNFYNLLLKLIKIDIPNEEHFLPKIIEDEINNLINNNNLLTEVNKYFNVCFEFYLIISSEEEGKNNFLKEKEFFGVLNHFEKIRYNILYLINMFYNSEQNFRNDLSTINKFINNKAVIKNNIIDLNKKDDINNEIIENVKKEEEKKKNLLKHYNIIDKIEKQFMFKNTLEKDKKIKIENALGIFKQKKSLHNYLGKIIKNEKKIQYKSIFDNKYFDKILHHCYENVKDKIVTQIITNEIDKGKRGKSYQVLKINYG